MVLRRSMLKLCGPMLVEQVHTGGGTQPSRIIKAKSAGKFESVLQFVECVFLSQRDVRGT